MKEITIRTNNSAEGLKKNRKVMGKGVAWKYVVVFNRGDDTNGKIF